MVCSELNFIAIFGLPRWKGHNASVRIEYIKPLRLCKECFSSLFDRIEVRQVTPNESDWYVWMLGVETGY